MCLVLWSKLTFPWNYRTPVCSLITKLYPGPFYRNGELVLKWLNVLLQTKIAVKCCLQNMLPCNSHQEAKQNFKYLELTQIISQLQSSPLCSAGSHTNCATQPDSAVDTTATLFWANINLTIWWSATTYLRHYIPSEFSIGKGIRNMES